MVAQKKLVLSVLALVTALAIAYFLFWPMLIRAQLPKPVALNIEGQPTLGDPTASIHIVSFEDLKCLNCARFNVDIFPKLKAKYVDKGIATYTVVNLAFVQGSMPAANAARCVYTQNHKAFFAFIDFIFQHQPPETENWATLPKLLEIGEKTPGVNTDQLAACMIQSPYTDFINNNLQLAMQVIKPRVATPTVFINGVLVEPLTLSQITRVIQAVK